MFGRRRVIAVVDALDGAGVPAWLDGGWGIEALLGEEQRIHGDLDVVLALGDVGRALEVLGRLGYGLTLDDRPTRAVVADADGHSVDLHPVTWDASGTGWQAGASADGGDCPYPADGFTAGTVMGQSVGCLTAALQLAHHVGYPPNAVDRSDVARLCTRFGLSWPVPYPAPFEDDGQPEEPLPGGNLTPVVRVGRTVRRGIGPWTPAVHALLDHLHAVGFGAAPQVLGIDRQGREVITLLDGRTLTSDRSSDHVVAGAGRLLKAYHEAVASFVPPSDAAWQRLPGTPDGDIIGHNDVSWWNVLFERGSPVGLVDWDLACPTTALWDLAYAAWRFVPYYNDADLPALGWPPVVDRPRRLRLLVDAYGLGPEGRRSLLAVVGGRMRTVDAAVRTWGDEDLPGWRDLLTDGWSIGGPLRDLAFLEAHADDWQDALNLSGP